MRLDSTGEVNDAVELGFRANANEAWAAARLGFARRFGRGFLHQPVLRHDRQVGSDLARPFQPHRPGQQFVAEALDRLWQAIRTKPNGSSQNLHLVVTTTAHWRIRRRDLLRFCCQRRVEPSHARMQLGVVVTPVVNRVAADLQGQVNGPGSASGGGEHVQRAPVGPLGHAIQRDPDPQRAYLAGREMEFLLERARTGPVDTPQVEAGHPLGGDAAAIRPWEVRKLHARYGHRRT